MWLTTRMPTVWLISYDSQKAESELTFEDVRDNPTVRWIIDAYAIYVPSSGRRRIMVARQK